VIGLDIVRPHFGTERLCFFELDLRCALGHDDDDSLVVTHASEGQTGREVAGGMRGHRAGSDLIAVTMHPIESAHQLERANRRPTVVLDPNASIGGQTECLLERVRSNQRRRRKVLPKNGLGITDIIDRSDVLHQAHFFRIVLN